MNQTSALKILKSGANVFLTGEPGSGKTHTINQYVKYLRSHQIEPAITASTGIAATHIGGMTVHSWSGIGIKNRLSKSDLHSIADNDYIKKRVGKAKVLIIDEISMLPPATLQMIDAICREVKKNSRPFGGVQVVLVGDFFQLPPVVKNVVNENSQDNLFEETPIRFAYDAPVWEQAEFVTCYITEQYRQDDDALLSILSKIRSNNFDTSSLNMLKQRKVDPLKTTANAPKLYSHNVDVDAVNNQMLDKISAKSQLFPMNAEGHNVLIKAMKKGCLSPESLYLKVGASVMFTKNNSKEGFVNGTLGEVIGFDKDSDLPIVRTRNGRKIKVAYADWTVEENGQVKGRISQIPLRLAWAITVHKSQGISLDEAIIDLSRVFEFGQGYVALSRVRRLSGICILGWNEIAFQVDPAVLIKDGQFYIQSSDAEKIYSRFSEEELAKMLKDFITLCDGAINATEVAPRKIKNKSSTYDETHKLWQEGKNIEQIAKIRHLNQMTILGHIEELARKGRIERVDLMRIVPKNLSSSLPIIHSVFRNLDTDRLSPVFEHFNAEYSYDELKLARMIME